MLPPLIIVTVCPSSLMSQSQRLFRTAPKGRLDQSEVVTTKVRAKSRFWPVDWLSVEAEFNSTTTVMPYNISVHTRVVDGEWSYLKEAYRLDIRADYRELNCEFVLDVLGIMEKVEHGYDTAEEVSRQNSLTS